MCKKLKMLRKMLFQHKSHTFRRKNGTSMHFKLVLLIILLILQSLSAILVGGWAGEGNWRYIQPITIESDYIDKGLMNFPFLAIVPTAVGALCQANGEDIRFYASDNTTQFAHEIEYWDATGDSYVWVNISETITNTTDYVFYCYYGNSYCSDGQDAERVWNSNYMIVQHLEGASVSAIDDSTSNNNDANVGGGTVLYNQAGKIGRCVDFDGDDQIEFGKDLSLKPTAVTISGWINTNETSGANTIFQMPYDDGAVWDAPYVGYGIITSGATIGGQLNDDGSLASVGGGTIVIGSWYYVTMTYDGTNIRLYQNITQTDSSVSVGSITYSGLPILATGVRSPHSTGEWWNGRVDELRVSDMARNSSWVNASFHNQNQSSHLGAFQTWGSRIDFPIVVVVNRPTNAATGIEYNVSLNISITHEDGASMDIIWRSNSTGSMELFGTNSTVANGTYYQTNTNFSTQNTTYWWDVNISDGTYYYNQTFYFTTWTEPENPSGISYTLQYNWLNLTWTAGTGADYTIVTRNNESIPQNHSDTYEACNYSASILRFNDSNISAQSYIKMYSYNSTNNIYSTGVSVPWGGLQVNAYNESDNSALSGWGLFITNQSGTQTYSNTNCDNSHTVNLTNLPIDSNVAIKVNLTLYKTRYYYIDITGYNDYQIINVYLPPDNDSELYLLTVEDEVGNPISDARMEIKQYVGTQYVNVSVLYTDGSGEVSLYLRNDTIYKINLTKEGYQDEIADFIPDPDLRTHTFVMLFEVIEPEPPEIPVEEITFEGYINSVSSRLFLNYTDRMDMTLNTHIVIVELDSAGTESLFATFSDTTDNDFQVNVLINTSRSYRVYLYYNHTEFGYQKQTLFFQGLYTPQTTETDVNLLFETNYGTSPGGMGWSNFIMWGFLLAGCIYADNRDSGPIMILLGGLFLFINSFIGFNNVLSTFAGGMIPVLFIVVGILIMWTDSRKKTIGG